MTASSSSSSSKDAAHAASIFKTSEFIGICILFSALFLQYWFPWDVPSFSVLALTIIRSVGGLLLLMGIYVLRWTHSELSQYGQPHAPGLPTTKLVLTGPFFLSRNPTYAALCFLILPGVGLILILHNPWLLAIAPVSCLVAFAHVMIQPEESYLKARFPGEYEEAYCSRTRRWI
jgi:protein-S-isoprenylcysteine O-methyltransferase Ste14